MCINLFEHDRGCLECVTCMGQVGFPDIEICAKCGGVIHVEFQGEECTEDFSDCWYTYAWKCDRCGDTSNDYLIAEESKKSVAELRIVWCES